MLPLANYTPTTFLRSVEDALANPAYILSVPLIALFEIEQKDQVLHFLDEKARDKPRVGEFALKMIPTLWAGGAPMVAANHIYKMYKHEKDKRDNSAILNFNIRRVLGNLSDKEKSLLRAMATLTAQKLVQPMEWERFLAHLAYGNGKGELSPLVEHLAIKRIAEVREIASSLIKHFYPDHQAVMDRYTADLVLHRAVDPAIGDAVNAVGQDGARWMTADDLATSKIYETKRRSGSLFLGYLYKTKQPVYYAGHESLITIAGPGAGKSSAQVIPNLLTYAGSAIVLDVKGELWDATASQRQTFGPVYRFAPTDTSGNTHCYNPFTHISKDFSRVAQDWQVFAEQIVLDIPGNKDPYWDQKGRDFIWAFGVFLTLTAPPQYQTLEQLAKLMSLPTQLETDGDRSTADPRTLRHIGYLRELSKATGITDLATAADTLFNSLGETKLESMMDSGRRFLTNFTRSPTTIRALSRTDWNPLDFRTKPGTTLYICVPDPETYGPLLRLMLFQHLRLLRHHVAKPDEPPITYFLDEMPRLGNFKQFLEIQDLGRGAGLRMWMFAQSYGQIVQNYGAARAPGVVSTSRVQMFFQPQSDEQQFIKPFLGDVKNIFTGEKQPLATPADLAGHKYADNTIAIARGSRPLLLDPRYAHKSRTLAKLIAPPPRIRQT